MTGHGSNTGYSGLENRRISAANGVTNGDQDPMIAPHYSYLLAGLISGAQLKIYPDAAHGFLFQHHAEFAPTSGPSWTAPGKTPEALMRR